MIGANERSGRVDVPFDNLAIKNGRIWQKYSKVVVFQNISIYEIFKTPFESGAVGALTCFANTSLLFIDS